MEKLRKIIRHESLSKPLKDALKKAYPKGYEHDIVTVNLSGSQDPMLVVTLEVDDIEYLIKVKRPKSKKAKTHRMAPDYTLDFEYNDTAFDPESDKDFLFG